MPQNELKMWILRYQTWRTCQMIEVIEIQELDY